MNFEIAQDPQYVKFGLIQDKKVVLHTLWVGQPLHLTTSCSSDGNPTVGKCEARGRLVGAGQSQCVTFIVFKKNYDQLVFKEYKFASYLRCTGLFDPSIKI